jgi:hypothetical protein
MNTTAILGSILQHLAAYELREPWSVSVNARPIPGRCVVSVQLAGGLLPGVASLLLTWADTLTEVSAEAWRVPDGSSVHLSIQGRLADGTSVCVFDGSLMTGISGSRSRNGGWCRWRSCGNGRPSMRGWRHDYPDRASRRRQPDPG